MSDVDALLEDPLEKKRHEAAARIQAAYDIDLPRISTWNYDPCPAHAHLEAPLITCMDCGIRFRRHQRLGISWLYLREHGLLADDVGTGKTIHAAALAAINLEKGRIGPGARAVVIARPAALGQWHAQLKRMVPSLRVITAEGTVKARNEKYTSEWDLCLIGPEMLRNDVDKLLQFPIRHVISDDVDALRNRTTATAKAVAKLGADAETRTVMTGTPLQKRLHEMYGVFEQLGLAWKLFGSEKAFLRRYVRSEPQIVYRGRRKIVTTRVVGYKNVDEFKELIAPYVMRRTASDITDVDLPEITPNEVWLDLYPKQRAMYEELREGVLRIEKDGLELVRHAEAMAKVIYGARICGGVGSVDPDSDVADGSVKLDWIMEQLTNSLEEEKVIVFAGFQDSVTCLQRRLEAEGIGQVTIWGRENNKKLRDERIRRFWEDDDCRVFIGTQAIEQSLNLQVARHMICMDTVMNPARMTQLAGRIRRDGSAFGTVFMHFLWTRDTQEEHYKTVLEREQALIDTVWNEDSELFETLSPGELLRLIGPRSKP